MDSAQSYKYNTIEEAVEELRRGKIILVTDDPDRENEGDMICAAEFATQANINFMATHAKGLICTPMSAEVANRLGLPPMVAENTDNHHTAFTVSVDHIDTTTGIIFTDGYDEKCIAHAVHPDSGVPYKGVSIPRWDEAVALAKAMALAMPGMTYIGWDLALTPDGWEPVEANRGEFIAQQITQGRGLRKEFEQACGL